MAETAQVSESPWRTPSEAARHIRCSRSFLLRKARSGEIRGHRLGRGWRFHIDALDAFMQRSREPPPVPVLFSPRDRG